MVTSCCHQPVNSELGFGSCRWDRSSCFRTSRSRGPEGRTDKGWICLNFVKQETVTDPADIISKGTVNEGGVNIRKTAPNGTLVGTYKAGDKVEITQKATYDGVAWGKTEKGWICLSYVTLDTPLTADTVIDKGTVT